MICTLIDNVLSSVHPSVCLSVSKMLCLTLALYELDPFLPNVTQQKYLHRDSGGNQLGHGYLIFSYAFPPIGAKWARSKFKNTIFILFFLAFRLCNLFRPTQTFEDPTQKIKCSIEIIFLFYRPPDSSKRARGWLE